MALMSLWHNLRYEEWTGNPVQGPQSPSPPNGMQSTSSEICKKSGFFSPQIQSFQTMPIWALSERYMQVVPMGALGPNNMVQITRCNSVAATWGLRSVFALETSPSAFDLRRRRMGWEEVGGGPFILIYTILHFSSGISDYFSYQNNWKMSFLSKKFSGAG